MMKILVINPNTTAEMTREIDKAAKRYAHDTTQIETLSPEWGPRSIEGHLEETLSAHATVEVVAANRDAYDAFVIACYGDPGLFAAREVTAAPVLGIAEASMLMACTVAHRFSVVTVIPRIVPMLGDLVRAYGLETRCASVRATNLSVLDIERDPSRAADEILKVSRRAIEEDGAEAITLGCAGMGPLDKKIQEGLDGVPVIDGVAAAVKMAEALHGYGVRTSKVGAFMDPEPKELVGVKDVLQMVAGG